MQIFGTWRSLEAHLNGVQGARGSNPRVPIIFLVTNMPTFFTRSYFSPFSELVPISIIFAQVLNKLRDFRYSMSNPFQVPGSPVQGCLLLVPIQQYYPCLNPYPLNKSICGKRLLQVIFGIF